MGNAVPTPDSERGAQLALLLIHFDKWVNRRVETVRFTDDGLARRYVSLDVSLDGEWMALTPTRPEAYPGTGVGLETRLLPLALLQKEPLSMLDVSKEDGSTMPVLGTSENGFLAYSALAAYSAELLGVKQAAELPEDLRRLLYRIARSPTEKAVAALEELRNSDVMSFRELSKDIVFTKLAADLSGNFVLLVEMEFDADKQVRRVVKFSYTIAPSTPKRRTLREWFRSPNEREYVFDLPSLGDAESHHFQLSPPVGITVSRCTLTATLPFRPVSHTAGALVGGTAHLHSSRVGTGASGTASVWLSASSHTVAPAALTSSVIFLLSAVLLGAHLWLDFPNPESDTGWLGVLIALPGLAAGFIANQGELGVQSRLLAETRFILSMNAATLIVVAFAAALGLSQGWIFWILTSFVLVSALCFGRLGQTYCMAHRAGSV